MSTHPNVILMAVLKPDDLARKTMREILAEFKVENDDDIKIGSKDYIWIIMEDDYDEGYQISSDEGDLIFFDLVTYGYGEFINWEKLEKQKQELEIWAKDICEKHNCQYEIRVSANYW
ncbi:MAG: hypothetical protein PVG39_02060 [Desulfobacteraceae bacterium]|jgi:hypothetical protein